MVLFLTVNCTPYRVIVKVTSKFSKKQLLARVVLFIKVNRTPYRIIAKVASKGVGMIRAEIGLKNRQIINETYSFRCFLIL
jgi:hypothetical protein